MTRRAAVLAALAAALLSPASSFAAEVPAAAVGAPLPATASATAASLLTPATVHATFRVPPAGTALYIATPWYVGELTAVITGPGPRRTTITATDDLPGHILGLRLPADAWQADRIDVDAVTVSTAAPLYLLPAEQLARVAWRGWSYAAFFGLFGALALLGAALALVRRSGTAAWYAAAAAAQAGLLIPWLGIVRPPPEISQPLHAAVQSLFFIALAAFAFAFLRGARVPRIAAVGVWALVAANAAAAVAADVLQDLYPLPDIATQSLIAALAIAYVALSSAAVRANVRGARYALAGTTAAALGFLAATAFPASLLQPAPLVTTAAEALLLALALTAHLSPGAPQAGSNAGSGAGPNAESHEAARAPNPAHLDGLTEIANRRALDDRLAAAWDHARRTQTPLAALLADLDHFHAYNESYGHLAGDDVLRRVAAALAAVAARAKDVTGRYAGDQFLALLADTDPAGARHLADAAHAAVLALDLAHGGAPSKRVTVSIGVAAVVPAADAADAAADAASLLRRAATALHIAKAMGRNRVVADEPIAPPVALR